MPGQEEPRSKSAAWQCFVRGYLFRSCSHSAPLQGQGTLSELRSHQVEQGKRIAASIASCTALQATLSPSSCPRPLGSCHIQGATYTPDLHRTHAFTSYRYHVGVGVQDDWSVFVRLVLNLPSATQQNYVLQQGLNIGEETLPWCELKGRSSIIRCQPNPADRSVWKYNYGHVECEYQSRFELLQKG